MQIVLKGQQFIPQQHVKLAIHLMPSEIVFHPAEEAQQALHSARKNATTYTPAHNVKAPASKNVKMVRIT